MLEALEAKSPLSPSVPLWNPVYSTATRHQLVAAFVLAA